MATLVQRITDLATAVALSIKGLKAAPTVPVRVLNLFSARTAKRQIMSYWRVPSVSSGGYSAQNQVIANPYYVEGMDITGMSIAVQGAVTAGMTCELSVYSSDASGFPNAKLGQVNFALTAGNYYYAALAAVISGQTKVWVGATWSATVQFSYTNPTGLHNEETGMFASSGINGSQNYQLASTGALTGRDHPAAFGTAGVVNGPTWPNIALEVMRSVGA